VSILSVAFREDDVLRALNALKVQRADLEDPARYAEWARDSGHPMDAPGFSGYSAYNMRMRRLGIRLHPRGYVRVNHTGVPFVYNEKLKVAITTSRGNEDVANPHRQPKTLFPKGGVAITLAGRNRREQPDLDGFVYTGEIKPTAISLPDDVATYYLLVDRRGLNIFAELSELIRIDERGFGVEWRPRIILGSFAVGEPSIEDDSDNGDESIDIDVSPRGH
jgi:hypothetical protein